MDKDLLERNEEIFRRYFLKGDSYRKIGKEFGLSYERVRQICMEMAGKKRVILRRKMFRCPLDLILRIKEEERRK